MKCKNWTLIETLVKLENKWITLIGERVENASGRLLDFWRVERSDSIIIIPIHETQLILPVPQYRHGIGKTTLDFPGGRYEGKDDLKDAAKSILKRELHLDAVDTVKLNPINEEGWIVDSSFSNQRIFSFEARFTSEVKLNPSLVYMRKQANNSGAKEILEVLSCLQCRCVLLEWMQGNLG